MTTDFQTTPELQAKLDYFDAALMAHAQQCADTWRSKYGKTYGFVIGTNNVPGAWAMWFVKHSDTYDAHTDIIAFDLKAGRFMKMRRVKGGVTIAKTQPKTPVTLDNYAFLKTAPGLKGIHPEPVVFLDSKVTGVRTLNPMTGRFEESAQ